MALPLTKEQYAFKAWAMACPGADEEKTGLYIDHIESMIEEAAKNVCDQVMKSDKWRILQTSFSATLSSDATGLGAAALSASIMGESVKGGVTGTVKHASYNMPLNYVPTIDDLYFPKFSSELGFYTVLGGNSSATYIYAADSTGAALTGSITGLACAYQSFSNLAPELEDEFLQTLADMAREKLLVLRTNPRLTGEAPPLTA